METRSNLLPDQHCYKCCFLPLKALVISSFQNLNVQTIHLYSFFKILLVCPENRSLEQSN